VEFLQATTQRLRLVHDEKLMNAIACTCWPNAIIAALKELANAPSSPLSPPKRFAEVQASLG
jgi:hypothetical protein